MYVTSGYASTSSTATWHAWTTTTGTTTACTSDPWVYWHDVGTTACSTAVWRTWTNDSTATTGTYIIADHRVLGWQAWQPQAEQKKLTRAELKAQRKRQADEEAARRLRQQEAERVLRLADEKRQQAAKRAEQLLLAHLTKEQAQAWTENRAIFVTGKSGKRYKLTDGHGGNMQELGPDGQPVKGFCVHVGNHIPSPDNVLAQKLALEHDEEAILRLANSWRIENGRRV